MAPVAELPGFYYDPEKNRYFPLKGRFPGSQTSRPSSSSSSSTLQNPSPKHAQATDNCLRTRVTIPKLLQERELYGKVIAFNKGKCNFMEEVLQRQASEPLVWKYQQTKGLGDGALELIHIDKHTLEGQSVADVLMAGSANGSLSLFEVGKVGPRFDNGIKCIPDRVRPANGENKTKYRRAPGNIWRPAGASLHMPSSISSMKLCGKHSHNRDDNFNNQRALITTLGSETHGGSVCILDLVEAFDFSSITSIRRNMHEVATFICTIWTADCNPKANQAVIGTNLGAALVNLETGAASWVCRSKSDVLAQTFDQLGNKVLCGLRNGAILTVDIRENSNRRIRHRIPYSPVGRKGQTSGKQWFEVKGSIQLSHTIYMPSSVCSLVPLQSYDQYFLASSMDGSIKLFDYRMTKRGFVQSYEGHVNSHTRLQLGVDHSERFLMAGGEDCSLRIWSIKSGDLLFQEKFSDSVLSTLCSRRSETFSRMVDEDKSGAECLTAKNNAWETWIGSRGGLFRMQWP